MNNDLGSRAIIVGLHVGLPQMFKQDKQRTLETNMRAGAVGGDAVTVNKRLFGKSQTAELVRAVGQLKKYFNTNTLPWDDNANRLLSADRLMNFMKEVREMKAHVEDTWKNFVDSFETNIQKRSEEMGDIFDWSDYPSREQIENKFYVSIETQPVPKYDNDIRVGDPELQKMIEQENEQRINDKVQKGLRSAFNRIYELVEHMNNRLREYDEAGKKKPPMFKSMLENIREQVNVLPHLNVTGDRDLDNMIQELRDKVLINDLDDLKNYPSIRKDAINETGKIVDALADLI